MLTNMITPSVPIWDAHGFLKEANLFRSKKTVFSVDKVEEVCTLFQGELRSSDIVGVIYGPSTYTSNAQKDSNSSSGGQHTNYSFNLIGVILFANGGDMSRTT